MIALAMDLVEERLRDGTASSQETTHFLKLGTIRAQTENETLKLQNELIKAKTERIQSEKKAEELFLNAISAMKNYRGDRSDEEDL